MALVVVGTPLRLAGAHGQERLAAIERLDLALLVHAQHHGALRRGQIEPDDVAYFFDKQRIGGELEGLAAVRLKTERLPDAVNG